MGSYQTNMQGNIATYNGSGTLLVCQKVFDGNTGSFVSASCGTSGTGSINNVAGYLGQSLWGYVQNGSTVNAHTVQGYWYSP